MWYLRRKERGVDPSPLPCGTLNVVIPPRIANTIMYLAKLLCQIVSTSLAHAHVHNVQQCAPEGVNDWIFKSASQFLNSCQVLLLQKSRVHSPELKFGWLPHLILTGLNVNVIVMIVFAGKGLGSTVKTGQDHLLSGVYRQKNNRKCHFLRKSQQYWGLHHILSIV